MAIAPADQSGAFEALTRSTAGVVLFVVLSVGYVLLGLWNLAEAFLVKGETKDRAVGGEGIRTETLPGGQAAQVIHVGPYDTMRETYGRLAAWLQEQGLTPASTMWESYLTEPDPNAPGTMLTQITWPVTAPAGE